MTKPSDSVAPHPFRGDLSSSMMPALPPFARVRIARSLLTAFLLLGCGVLGMPGDIVAQQDSEGSIRGQVVDATLGRGIPAALVEFVDPGGRVRATATAGEDGSFFLARVPRGEFRLRISSLGYARTLSPSRRIEGGETLSLLVQVEPEAIALAPLEVTGSARTTSPVLSAFQARAERGVGGIYITRDDIERRSPSRVSDLLATVPGVHLENGGAPGASPGVLLSGSPSGIGGRPCAIQLFLDGVPVGSSPGLQGLSPSSVRIDQLVTPDQVEGIEIYQSLGDTPPQFLTQDARCGVVAIWRRARG
jgi:hypothetical protein